MPLVVDIRDGEWETMISIQSSLTELDRIHQVREELLGCYLGAIRNCANYALDMDEEVTAAHRKHLRSLADEVAEGDLPEVVESQSRLRNLLRDYRDKGSEYLSTLRDELSGTARALEEILDSLSQADGDHETRLRATVQSLRELAQSPEARALSGLLRSAASSIEQSLEQIRKQYQVTVSQFQIEIRMLHKRIDSLQTAASVDEATHFYTRAEMEMRIKGSIPGDYCLILITARGLRRAEEQFGSAVAEELTGAFAKRLRNSLPPTTVLARWGREEAVALIRSDKNEAVATGKWITHHLSGSYVCLSDGKTVRPALQLNVGVVDTTAGEHADAIMERIGIFLTGT